MIQHHGDDDDDEKEKEDDKDEDVDQVERPSHCRLTCIILSETVLIIRWIGIHLLVKVKSPL